MFSWLMTIFTVMCVTSCGLKKRTQGSFQVIQIVILHLLMVSMVTSTSVQLHNWTQLGLEWMPFVKDVCSFYFFASSPLVPLYKAVLHGYPLPQSVSGIGSSPHHSSLYLLYCSEWQCVWCVSVCFVPRQKWNKEYSKKRLCVTNYFQTVVGYLVLTRELVLIVHVPPSPQTNW